MSHFSEQVWADFVRGIGTSETEHVLLTQTLIQARSKEEALEWASRCPDSNCRIEVRRVFEMEDFPQDVQDAYEGP